MRWFVLLLLLVGGCAPKPDLRPADVPAAEILMAKVVEAGGRYRSLDAEAGVGLTTRGKYFPSQQFMLLERPDRLRLDVLTGFGQLVLQLTSDGRDMAVFLNDKVPGRYFYGPATYANMTKFIRVPLEVRDLLSLFLYDPPLIGYNGKRSDLVDDHYRLVLTGSGNEQRLLFDVDLKLVGCRYYVDQTLVLSVDYEKIQEPELFPRKVTVEAPAEETRIVLKYSEVNLNAKIDGQRFKLEPPANSVREPLL